MWLIQQGSTKGSNPLQLIGLLKSYRRVLETFLYCLKSISTFVINLLILLIMMYMCVHFQAHIAAFLHFYEEFIRSEA